MGINMISILVLSCLVVLPAVLANDPPCTRCCNLESTVVESALRLVQCEKGVVDCPEEQNTVTYYLPEYMRCLIKSRKRVAVSEDPDCQDAGHGVTTCGRDGRSLQFICGLLPANVASVLPFCGSGSNDSDDDSDASDDDSDASEDESDGSEEEDEDEEDEDEE